MELVDTFAEPIDETPPEALASGFDHPRVFNTGELLCEEESDRIFLLHGNVPYLRAFDGGGRELWRTRLMDAYGMRLYLVRDRYVAYGSESETGVVDHGRALFLWGEDSLGVSLERRLSRDEARYEMRLVQASTGEELKQYATPMIVVGVERGRLVGYVNHPYPEISIFSGDWK
jgi:hypothetical protein